MTGVERFIRWNSISLNWAQLGSAGLECLGRDNQSPPPLPPVKKVGAPILFFAAVLSRYLSSRHRWHARQWEFDGDRERRPVSFSSTLYTQGTTNNVRTVETRTPPMTDIAIGIRLSAPGPIANAGGIAPAIVASDVIKIGRSRMGQASVSAASTPNPFSRI